MEDRLTNKPTKDKRQKAVSCVSTKLFLRNKEYADLIYKGLRRQLLDCLDRHLRVDEPILIELQEPIKTTDSTMMETIVLQELVLRDLICCKDCRHWRRLWHNKPDGICRLYDISDGEFSTNENDYCSKAERRDDNG